MEVIELFNNLDLFLLSNRMFAIKNYFNNESAKGLQCGGILEKIQVEYICKHIENCYPCNEGQADIMIKESKYSIKNITKKSKIGVCWSKNPNIMDIEIDTNILIFVSEGSYWWAQKDHFDEYIPAGIYYVPIEFCKNIKYIKNNKSDYIISEQDVYKLLCKSLANKYYLELPRPFKLLEYSFTYGFTPQTCQ